MELLEIEKELREEGEVAVRRYDEKLLAMQVRLERALRSGVTPEEFPRCQELQEAIVVARKLLRLQAKTKG